MTTLDAPPATAAPWAAENFQVKRNGTRGYADTLPPCALIPNPHAEPVPGFSSLKPSKPFRKSVMVGDRKYTVPLDWYRAGEWFKDQPDELHEGGTDRWGHAFYQAVHVQRDRDFARGHAIHAVAEDVLAGKPISVTNPDAAPYIPHLAEWLERNITSVTAIEAVVFGQGYGGTGDAWLTVRGIPCYVDWKSRGADSAHGIYEGEVSQGGAYTSARYCIVPSDDRLSAVRAPIPPADMGLVLSIRPDGVEEFWYDLATARESFAKMHEAYIATSDSGKLARKAKRKVPTEEQVYIPAPTVSETRTEPLRANLLARAKAVAAINRIEAAIFMQRMGQACLPKLSSNDPITDEQFARIERLIQQSEARVSAPFADLPAEPLPEVPSVAVERPTTLDVTVDHGGTVDPQSATYQELAAAVGRLDPAGRAWLQDVRSEAQAAGRDFHVSTNPTVRNVRIVTGLAMLAADAPRDESLGFEEALDAISAALRDPCAALVHLATGVDAVLWPSVPLGAAVSIMSAAEAATFVGAVELLAAGRLEAVCDGELPMRLREVA